jgi:hypothetical protein
MGAGTVLGDLDTMTRQSEDTKQGGRDAMMTVRLTTTERELIEQVAEAREVTMSDVTRAALGYYFKNVAFTEVRCEDHN